MRSDHEVKQDVERALEADSRIGARDIATSVRDGVVTLAGFARSFRERSHAEALVKRVYGVVGLANDIEVRLPVLGRKPDPDIAREVVARLTSEIPTLWERIRVTVADGQVKLEGDVEWEYQRGRAEEVVQSIKGVRGIENEIVVKPQILSVEIKRKIEEAFKRIAEIHSDGITVETADNGTVILTGCVGSWAEMEEAERTARSEPGVNSVENRIELVADMPG
jgi:osmotically-inducible protein OsmY